MNWKTTTILLVIVVALGLYIKFYESKQPGTEEAQRQAKNVVNFTPDDINGIVIQNGDEKIDLRRHDKKWRLEAPVKDQADGSQIDSLLSDLENWPKDATITAKEIDNDKAQLAEYGLNKPKLRLKLTGKAAPPEIWFGKDAALEGKIYVRLENSKSVFLAGQSMKKEIEKKPDDFRDRQLTDLSATEVSKVVIKTGAGEMELQKQGEHWEIVKPLRARGDDQKIGDLIAQITTARIQQFVADDHGDLRPYGLAEPRGSITIFEPESEPAAQAKPSHGEPGLMLQIGAVPEKEKDQVYVRFSPRSFVYTLPRKIESILDTKPNDLRDRHFVRIDQNILDRITIEEAGRNKTVLARKDDHWTIANHKNAQANSAEVHRLIDTLSNALVTKFVDNVASDLPKYGLDKPQLQVVLSSFASENTAETKAGERPFATVSFGKTEGDEVYARVSEEPFVVAVKHSLVENIFSDPLQWQELAIFKYKPEQIHRLSVVTDTELSLVRGPNKQWTWAKGTGPIDQTNLQSLLNTLSSLHAVRWIGSNPPPHAFEKPQVVITFTTSPDDKAMHKLTVGGPAGNGMWVARTDEREGVFVISNPDFNALRLSLVQPVAATPTPTPSSAINPTASPMASATP